MTTVQEVASGAEKAIEAVMKVEPTIIGVSSMFVPGAAPIVAMVQPWVITVVPFIEKALNDIAAGQGVDAFQSFVMLLQHISKGLPNTPALAPAAHVADPSTIGNA